MVFIATIDPKSALAPDYAGTRRTERWTCTAAAADAGTGTIAARHLVQIDDFECDFYNGTGPTTYQIVGSTLILTLPGSTTATLYRINLWSRY